MSEKLPETNVPALRDPDAAHPVATAWRAHLRGIVEAIALDNYTRLHRAPSVAPLSPAVEAQIRSHIEDYGECIVALPEDSWNTSEAQWMGDHWIVLVDLWTAESGESDLVLHARVFETDEGFRFEVESVHVP